MRSKYALILYIEKMLSTTKNAQLSSYLENLKREVRRTNKPKPYSVRKIFVRNDGLDGWCEKHFLPYHFSKPKMKRYIFNHKIELSRSQYDCTGQIYTTDIKIFNVPSGSIVYHFKSVNV